MILTAHQPVYLPWLGLFHKIALADSFVSFNQVQYLPKDWNNRNRIKTAVGSKWLTVPVLKAGHREKVISEIEINNNVPWRRKHWQSLYINYKKAPYFDKYAPFFEDVYKREWDRLVELNEYMLQWFLKILGIDVKFLDASKFSFEGKKSALVLDMCSKLNADTYIFGKLGKDYVEISAFNDNNIDVIFQDYKHPVYSQLHGNFLSHMSIVDLLFNCGNKSLDITMQANRMKIINKEKDLLRSRR